MPHPLNFDTLTGLLHQQLDVLPEHRKPGPKTRYTLKDAALGAFGVFDRQSPSFLDYQRPLQHTKGRNNASTLFRLRRYPVIIRYATCSIRCNRVSLMRSPWRALTAWNTTAYCAPFAC